VKRAVGIVIIAKDTNRFLLLHRSTKPIVWSVLSGTMEDTEKEPIETLKREIKEEIRINPDFIDDIQKLGEEKFGKTLFHIFVGFVDSEFDIPNIKKDENDKYGWFDEENLPNPIHKRWPKTFQLIKPILDLRESFKNNFNNLLNG
jgi:8-oxo-dGTP pyrophosphatase MutT (NUDIX family)